jgi:hypothetical protein
LRCARWRSRSYASSRGHALIDRALYLPAARAADEEHRELAGIRAAFVTGDEVYGGRELR